MSIKLLLHFLGSFTKNLLGDGIMRWRTWAQWIRCMNISKDILYFCQVFKFFRMIFSLRYSFNFISSISILGTNNAGWTTVTLGSNMSSEGFDLVIMEGFDLVIMERCWRWSHVRISIDCLYNRYSIHPMRYR